jgi:hypothetical protein
LLPPCDVEPESLEPRPLLLLEPESSEELDPELPEPPELPELPSSELVEVAVVPELSGCFADRTATDSPVPPIPITAVAIAATPARRIHRLRAVGLDSSKASVVTMAVSLAGGSSAALQGKVKRPSSSPESSLRAVLRLRRDR